MDTTDAMPGMTMRDYFAGQVLAVVYEAAARPAVFKPATIHDIAEKAYQIADAMLAERAKLTT